MKTDMAKLPLFVGNENILTLKGQLYEAAVSEVFENPNFYSIRYPAVVPMLRGMREDNHHEGTKHERNLIQQQLWIFGLRSALHRIIAKCIVCKNLSFESFYPHLTDLRKELVEGDVYPFKHNGVVYFGSFQVTIHHRPVMHWCCLLTCVMFV